MLPNTHISKCRDVQPLQCFAPMDPVIFNLRPPSSCVHCVGSDMLGRCHTVPKFFWGKGNVLESLKQQLTPQLLLALI